MSPLSDILKPKYRKKIKAFLVSFLKQKEKEYKKREVMQKLSAFSVSGKLVRGSLVCFIYELFMKEISEEVVKAAAAVELIHGAFLIHDDIMDQDVLRRGEKTISAQYEELGKKLSFPNPSHFGESIGICIGDIAYFLGFSLLSEIQQREVFTFCSHEFTNVALAQIDDVYNGESPTNVEEDAILSTYIHKTGRYTFSVPFAIGTILAKEKNEIREALETLGELFGLLFQLKDDELGLFGREEKIGKSIGSDIKENKKTLFRKYLFDNALLSEKQTLQNLFGNEKISKDDIAFVVKLMEKYHIKGKVHALQEKLFLQAKHLIERSDLPQKEAFFTLLTYNMQRDN